MNGICAQRTGIAAGGIFYNVPELKPIKDTKIENIFYCSQLMKKIWIKKT